MKRSRKKPKRIGGKKSLPAPFAKPRHANRKRNRRTGRVAHPSGAKSETAANPVERREAAFGRPPAVEESSIEASRAALIARRMRGKIEAGLRERIIDFGGLSGGMRFLARLGYGGVASLLAAVLLFETLGERMPTTEFSQAGSPVSLPLPVAWVSGLAFAAGWAFILTGASDCRRRVFLPVAGLFIFQIFLLSSAVPADVILVMWTLAMVLVVAPVVLHFFTRHHRRWRDYAAAEFLFWLAVVSVLVAFPLIFGGGVAEAASALDSAIIILMLLSTIFWAMLALDVVDLATSLSRVAVGGMSTLAPGKWFTALAVAVLIAHPMGAQAAAYFATRDGGAFGWLDQWASVALLVAAIVLALARRWTVRVAAALLALSVAVPLLDLAASLGQDFAEAAISASGVLPPALLFAGLMGYDVMNFGARFAKVDGRVMPRAGRTLVYFGSAILVIGFALFYLNLRVAETGQPHGFLTFVVDTMFVYGLMLLGPLYLIWILWKRRERLIGDPPAFTYPERKETT